MKKIRRPAKRRQLARCIAIDEHGWRCSQKAAATSGDIFVCRQHSRLLSMALIDQGCRVETRQMLAYKKWDRYAEGLAIVEHAKRMRAAWAKPMRGVQ